MYVKRHEVRKDGKRYVYLRLVEAYRDEGGKVPPGDSHLGPGGPAESVGPTRTAGRVVARLDPPPAGPAATSARCCWWLITFTGWAW